jgi:ribosomal protein L14
VYCVYENSLVNNGSNVNFERQKAVIVNDDSSPGLYVDGNTVYFLPASNRTSTPIYSY